MTAKPGQGRARRGAVALAALLVWSAAAVAGEPVRLSDRQLDGVNAGLGATARGSGAAGGAQSGATVSVASVVGQPNPDTGSATGQVTAAGLASTAGPLATASATLSLGLTIP